jgi:signal transduction histidine kinase
LYIVEDTLQARNIKILSVIENDDKVLMYQNEMMQVILNIIKNAEDNFLENRVQNPQIFIITKKKEGKFVISISDNGGGITPDVLPKIFDPYFSTKDEKNGTGLGLYMSKIMVEEHNNGKLSVENIADGVCFSIELSAEV